MVKLLTSYINFTIAQYIIEPIKTLKKWAKPYAILKQMRNISSQQRNIDVIRSPRNSNRQYPTTVSNGKISLGRNKINWPCLSVNTSRWAFKLLKNNKTELLFLTLNPNKKIYNLLKNNLNNVDLLKTNDLKDNFKTIKKLENVQELINQENKLNKNSSKIFETIDYYEAIKMLHEKLHYKNKLF